jgi:hypothetical protein
MVQVVDRAPGKSISKKGSLLQSESDNGPIASAFASTDPADSFFDQSAAQIAIIKSVLNLLYGCHEFGIRQPFLALIERTI